MSSSLSMAINMKRRYSGDDSSQEPERKRSAQAYLPLPIPLCGGVGVHFVGWFGRLICRVVDAYLVARKKCVAMEVNQFVHIVPS